MGQMNWTEKIPHILYAMRGTPSTKSSLFSPYHLVFGQEMRMPADSLFMKTNKEMLGTDAPTSVKGKKLLEYLENLKPKLQLLRQICAENNKIAQTEQARQFDKKAHSRSFCEGTKVLLFKHYVKPGIFGKTMIRYEGPFIIVSRISRDLYMIRDAESMKMHATPVNVTKLKLFRPQISNLEQFKDKGTPENVLAGPTHQTQVENRTYELPADSEDEDENVEGEEGARQVSDHVTSPSQTSIPPVDIETPSSPIAEAVEASTPPPSSEEEEENLEEDNSTPELIDHEIQQIIARRGKSKSRLYKAVYKDTSKADAWVLPHTVEKELLHEFFVREQQKIELKKDFLRRAREIKVRVPAPHGHNTRYKAIHAEN